MSTRKLQIEDIDSTHGAAAVNDRLINKLDMATQLVLKSTTTTVPPSSPALGDTYWLDPTVSYAGTAWGDGPFGGLNSLATWWFGWRYIQPYEGMLAYIDDEKRFASYQLNRSWATIVRTFHYSNTFTEVANFQDAQCLFYTERGCQVLQIFTGLHVTTTGSVDFKLMHYRPLAIGLTPTYNQILVNSTETVTDSSLLSTWSIHRDIPADSWIRYEPSNPTGTPETFWIELLITETV